MSQETRNKIYAAITALLTILLIAGVITEADRETILDLSGQALTLVGNALGIVGAVIAWWKSRTSQVTTVEVPKAEIISVDTVRGNKSAEDAVTPARKRRAA